MSLQTHQYKPKLINEFDYCLRTLFDRPSSMVLIVGDWKTGKTDFGLLIAERLLELNVVREIASNIETNDERITFITDLPSLKQWLHKDNIRKLYIFDEAGVHLHKRRSMSAKNVAIVTLLPEISKAHARLIAIMQNPRSIDSEMLDPTWCKGLIQKLSKYRARFVSELFIDKVIFEFEDVPRTSIKFDPYKIAPFRLTTPKDIPSNLKTKDLQILWQWAINGKTCNDLQIHSMTLNRLVRAFVRDTLNQKSEVT